MELISMPHMSSAEVVHHLTFGDIFVQSPDLRWCLLHNCQIESLAVMRQLCSTFVRDVPRVINSKDWQLKHRCVILYQESSRKLCTTFYRRDPQEAGWLAFITGSDMARPDLVMRQLAAGMASSRVYSFIWTNFEVSPDSSRLDSSYGKTVQTRAASTVAMGRQRSATRVHTRRRGISRAASTREAALGAAARAAAAAEVSLRSVMSVTSSAKRPAPCPTIGRSALRPRRRMAVAARSMEVVMEARGTAVTVAAKE